MTAGMTAGMALLAASLAAAPAAARRRAPFDAGEVVVEPSLPHAPVAALVQCHAIELAPTAAEQGRTDPKLAAETQAWLQARAAGRNARAAMKTARDRLLASARPVIAQRPDSVPATCWLATADAAFHEARERYGVAFAAFEACMEKGATSCPEPRVDFREGISLVDRYLERFPDHTRRADALYLRLCAAFEGDEGGAALIARGRQALREFPRHPDGAEIEYRMAQAYEDAADPREHALAAGAYAGALERAPLGHLLRPEIRRCLGLLLQRQGDLVGARRVFIEQLAEKPAPGADPEYADQATGSVALITSFLLDPEAIESSTLDARERARLLAASAAVLFDDGDEERGAAWYARARALEPGLGASPPPVAPETAASPGDAVRRYVTKRRHAVDRCYQIAAVKRHDRPLQGTVTLDWKADGALSLTAGPTRGGAPDPAFWSCIARKLGGGRLPAAAAGRATVRLTVHAP